MTRSQDFLSAPEIRAAAVVLDPESVRPTLWTDEYTSLFRLLR